MIGTVELLELSDLLRRQRFFDTLGGFDLIPPDAERILGFLYDPLPFGGIHDGPDISHIDPYRRDRLSGRHMFLELLQPIDCDFFKRNGFIALISFDISQSGPIRFHRPDLGRLFKFGYSLLEKLHQ
jgi:hypothetical protein